MSPTSSDLSRIPWCAHLLADDRFVVRPTSSRQPKSSGEDSLIAETLQSDRTIRLWLTQHRKPDHAASPAIPAVRAFLQLGDGLNGYPATCHGGLIATLLDEIMGVLLTANVDHTNRNAKTARGLSSMTAYLNVSYKKPLPLPAVILATARYAKVVGRKQYISAALEDGNGRAYATAEALFIEIKPSL
ncbi:uncharacterized protein K452DRAFT_291115 [Aplosporella prunicola CBS 121167]|uniref:Thioesterase domain-containing protein n=1 Tax=Aplosporella prunicola CBS 121167 TaxID=1176127 RepID=A0A6A6B484_9PEZI|nr:uncharacterized protein K452DRAFT_291115 [Aplosporella prunicola CBS 121167]KAF2138075.1 hypothetical protein K452DRAFT_291115 [Aplosporella prunicola CBS 121167]